MHSNPSENEGRGLTVLVMLLAEENHGPRRTSRAYPNQALLEELHIEPNLKADLARFSPYAEHLKNEDLNSLSIYKTQ